MKMLIFVLICLPSLVLTQDTIAFQLAYSGFSRPVDISDPEDGTDRLFIVEQEGIIKIIENGNVLATPFLNITSKVQCCGERGLLGLVFHPNYEVNGYFFVNYIDEDRNTVIARFSVSGDANIADALSEVELISFFQPFGNHNAGDLNFSPLDGLLYIALGDGGSGGDPGCRAQDTTTFMGKILRVDVDQNVMTPPYYGIPTGNLKDEIWALGLRNPWRVSFDRETGDLWIADVGQGLWEEVNFVAAGATAGLNFGWKRMEGNSCYSGGSSGCGSTVVPACNSTDYLDPIYVMPHSVSNSDLENTTAKSITGGYVYRGCKYPNLVGKYICTDYVTRNSFVMNEVGTSTAIAGGPSSVSSYGEDHEGELWVASLNGNLYRLIDPRETKTLTLSAENYPLSGTYRAVESINITDPLNQSLIGVKFISETINLSENVTIPQSGNLIVSDNFCEE